MLWVPSFCFHSSPQCTLKVRPTVVLPPELFGGGFEWKPLSLFLPLWNFHFSLFCPFCLLSVLLVTFKTSFLKLETHAKMFRNKSRTFHHFHISICLLKESFQVRKKNLIKIMWTFSEYISNFHKKHLLVNR